MQQDDELVRRHWKPEPAGAPQKRPRLDPRLWTPERAALTDVADILLMIHEAIRAQASGKSQKPQRMPRPEMARDRIARAEARRRHLERVALMTPERS
jgi:hypothetical protein